MNVAWTVPWTSAFHSRSPGRAAYRVRSLCLHSPGIKQAPNFPVLKLEEKNEKKKKIQAWTNWKWFHCQFLMWTLRIYWTTHRCFSCPFYCWLVTKSHWHPCAQTPRCFTNTHQLFLSSTVPTTACCVSHFMSILPLILTATPRGRYHFCYIAKADTSRVAPAIPAPPCCSF